MSTPEIYAELDGIFTSIGVLICEFANFEGYLAPMLALMINDNGDQASTILGQVDSFSYKWATVVGVAETLRGKNPVADAVLSLQDDIKTANTFRNKLAHSGTRIKNGKLWLITNATTTKRGLPKGEHLTRPIC